MAKRNGALSWTWNEFEQSQNVHLIFSREDGRYGA